MHYITNHPRHGAEQKTKEQIMSIIMQVLAAHIIGA